MGDRTLGLLSPVRGEVVEVNKEVECSPEIVSNDPYGNGWLMKVRVPHAKAVARTLLSGELAKAWMRDTAERLGKMIEQDQGGLQQDGGYPITGFGRQLDPERFEQIVKELLLTETTDGSEGG